MPGVQIIQLPIITTLSGTEAIPLETQAGVTGQMSTSALAAALSPLQSTQFIDAGLPAGLSSNVNPVGYQAGTAIVKLTSVGNAAFSVDGFIAPAASKFLYLVNANTAIGGSLTLVDATGSASLAANQILTEAGAGLTILYNKGVLLWYDPERAKWRVM